MTPQLVINPLKKIMRITIIGSHTFFVIMNVAIKSDFMAIKEVKSNLFLIFTLERKFAIYLIF